ncbi:MAG: hypothetical protein ACOY4F_05645 [Thermodesulfobacteriota bacterium]
MRPLLLVCLAAACLAATGCVTAKKSMSLSDFRGFCLTSGGGKNGACDTNDICYSLAARLEEDFGSLGRCLDACRDFHAREAFANSMNRCAGTLNTARNLCIQYCRSTYGP